MFLAKIFLIDLSYLDQNAYASTKQVISACYASTKAAIPIENIDAEHQPNFKPSNCLLSDFEPHPLVLFHDMGALSHFKVYSIYFTFIMIKTIHYLPEIDATKHLSVSFCIACPNTS